MLAVENDEVTSSIKQSDLLENMITSYYYKLLTSHSGAAVKYVEIQNSTNNGSTKCIFGNLVKIETNFHCSIQSRTRSRGLYHCSRLKWLDQEEASWEWRHETEVVRPVHAKTKESFINSVHVMLNPKAT